MINNTALSAPMQFGRGFPLGRSNMLKIRLQGTKNDIKWFKKILEQHPKIDMEEFSDCFPNKGTNKYYRVYAEIHKANTNHTNKK